MHVRLIRLSLFYSYIKFPKAFQHHTLPGKGISFYRPVNYVRLSQLLRHLERLRDTIKFIWRHNALCHSHWTLGTTTKRCSVVQDHTPRYVSGQLSYTPEQRSCWGVYWFHSVRPSVCRSVRLSVRPSRLPCPLYNIYSSGWIISILVTNDLYHERVCRTQWPLTLTYIFKVIRPWLSKSCPLCSVYSSGWILFIFGTNDHCHSRVCRVLRFFSESENLNFWNFSALPWKKNLQFSMDSFHI